MPGVLAVHELHIWRLNQQKTLASAHVYLSETTMSSFMTIANTINECLHAYGIHSATLQPEFSQEVSTAYGSVYTTTDRNALVNELRERSTKGATCMVGCQGSQCVQLSCCD